jgi:uncharacterized protein YndB with AHSA1/START domain
MGETTVKQDLVLTRIFDAPLEKVWRAWTDSDGVMSWWGPDCFTCPAANMDVREGGTSVVAMRDPNGADLYNSWTYTKIEPSQSLEFIQNMSDAAGAKLDPASLGLPPEFPVDQRNLVTFKTTAGGGTEMTVTQFDWTVCPFLTFAEMGWSQSLAKMSAAL